MDFYTYTYIAPPPGGLKSKTKNMCLLKFDFKEILSFKYCTILKKISGGDVRSKTLCSKTRQSWHLKLCPCYSRLSPTRLFQQRTTLTCHQFVSMHREQTVPQPLVPRLWSVTSKGTEAQVLCPRPSTEVSTSLEIENKLLLRYLFTYGECISRWTTHV